FALDVDRGNLGVGADLGAGGAGGGGDRLGDRAHAAHHVPPGAFDPVQFAERVVEEVVGGAGGVGAGPDADHAGRGDRALDRVVLEVLVEHVGDRHREHADQLVDGAGREAG